MKFSTKKKEVRTPYLFLVTGLMATGVSGKEVSWAEANQTDV